MTNMLVLVNNCSKGCCWFKTSCAMSKGVLLFPSALLMFITYRIPPFRRGTTFRYLVQFFFFLKQNLQSSCISDSFWKRLKRRQWKEMVFVELTLRCFIFLFSHHTFNCKGGGAGPQLFFVCVSCKSIY